MSNLPPFFESKEVEEALRPAIDALRKARCDIIEETLMTGVMARDIRFHFPLVNVHITEHQDGSATYHIRQDCELK